MKTGQDLIAEAKAKITEVSVEQAKAKHGRAGVAFLDCREPNEFNLGRIPGAVFIPRGQLETNVEARIPRDQDVVIYCATGNRSALAAVTLTEMGYDRVASMAGGFKAWAMGGNPIEG
ncbi:MAG: sulfurtransferase [Gemmatimonadetes bacterium]|nr:sulfurtransferase [Gemmatimonadota bacterium]